MAASSGASKNPDRGRHERIQQWKRIYEKWDLDAGKKLIFEPEPWLAAFSQASRTRDGEALRAMRYGTSNLLPFMKLRSRKACQFPGPQLLPAAAFSPHYLVETVANFTPIMCVS